MIQSLLRLSTIAILLMTFSCGADEREEILVFAAASLSDAMDRLGKRFTEIEGVSVRFNLGASTALAQQIIRGAPADGFISAGPRPMTMLDGRGLISADTRRDLLTNHLVLVGDADIAAKLGITSVEDLAIADVRVAIADPDLAPAGRYAREALQNLGLWERLEPRLVFGFDVRVALGYVESGNVDVGIVYGTDAEIATGLEVLGLVPEESYPPIVYPAAVVARSNHVDATRRFLAYLTTEEAKETFRQYGFTPSNQE